MILVLCRSVYNKDVYILCVFCTMCLEPNDNVPLCSCNSKTSKTDLLILNSDHLNHYLYSYSNWRYLIAMRFFMVICLDLCIKRAKWMSRNILYLNFWLYNRKTETAICILIPISIDTTFSLHLVPHRLFLKLGWPFRVLLLILEFQKVSCHNCITIVEKYSAFGFLLPLCFYKVLSSRLQMPILKQ